MKKRTLALAMAAIMGLTTACSGGGQTQQNAAAPAKETEKTGGVAAGGESGEAVTIKIANYALLEAGYDEFWGNVKTGFEEKYPNVTIEWLTTPGTAMFALICANVWIGIPFNMILISTGLTTIPKELYESASIDGANKIQTFFNITLPLLKPTIESVLILGFIYTFKVYDLVYVMTSGGPVNSTHMLSTYSYKLSFEMFKYSKGSAVANVLLAILLVVGIFYIKVTTSGEEE